MGNGNTCKTTQLRSWKTNLTCFKQVYDSHKEKMEYNNIKSEDRKKNIKKLHLVGNRTLV